MYSIEQLADEIFRHGVPMVFGIPGSGPSLTLIDALEKRGIPFHLTHFEGSGALMAATLGHLTGPAGVSLSIKGPGFTNALPGIAVAWFENYPLVHIAEASLPDAPLSQAHKRLDQAALIGAISKGARHFGLPGGFQSFANHALTEAPGPVLMNLAPKAVSREPAFEAPVLLPARQDEALDMVRKAGNPVVIAGAAAVRAGLGQVLGRLSCPVFSTAAAKGVVNESAPHACGVYTGVGLTLTPEASLLAKADLVVGLGLTAKEVLAAKPFACEYLSIETIGSLGSEAFAPSLTVGMGAAEAVCEALAAKRAWGLDELRGILSRLQGRMAEQFLPGAVFNCIAEAIPDPVRMVMDTGYFCTVGEHAWRAPDPALCLFSGQGRYMGTCLPMALGAALYDPSIPTVAILGDGGIGMYLAEARLAAQHKLPLLVVLMTDNAFGSIRTRALKDNLTQKPLITSGKSWTPIFESLGLASERAETLSAVEKALRSWRPEDGPAFLEIPFQPDLYEAMVKDIR